MPGYTPPGLLGLNQLQLSALSQALSGLGGGLLSGQNWSQGLGMGIQGANQGIQIAQEQSRRNTEQDMRQKILEFQQKQNEQQQAAQEAQTKALQNIPPPQGMDPAQWQNLLAGMPDVGTKMLENQLVPKEPGNPFAAYYQDFVKANKRNPTQDEILKFVQAEHPGTSVSVQNKVMGTPPPDYKVNFDDAGNPVSMSVIPGSATETAQKTAKVQQLRTADIVLNKVKEAKDIIKTAQLPTTGLVGSWLQNTGGTDANNLRAAVETLKANMTIDRLQELRKASSSGASGFGQLNEAENKRLETAMANLDQSQSQDQFLKNLDEVEKTYNDIAYPQGGGPSGGISVPAPPEGFKLDQ